MDSASLGKITIGVSVLEWKTLRLIASDLIVPALMNSTDIIHIHGDNLVVTLDRLQHWLDLPSQSIQSALSISPQGIPQFYRRIRRVLLRLAMSSNQLPNSLFVVLDDMQREPFGGGAFADVFRGIFKGTLVASKRLRIFETEDSRDRIHARFCREVVLWKPLDHENILPFLGVYVDPLTDRWCMISPWMPNGNMVEFIAKARYTSEHLQRLLVEIARGLVYLHSKSVVHGDLRGANILIDEKQHARLADFGLTVMLSATATMGSSGGAGSARWMAPELHNAGDDDHSSFQRSPASDIYSFASVCLEAYTRRPPFAEISNDITAVLRILQGKHPRRPSAEHPGTSVPNHLWELMIACWHGEPSFRPAAADLEPAIWGRPLQRATISSAGDFSLPELVTMERQSLVPREIGQEKQFDDSLARFLASENKSGLTRAHTWEIKDTFLIGHFTPKKKDIAVAELPKDITII